MVEARGLTWLSGVGVVLFRVTALAWSPRKVATGCTAVAAWNWLWGCATVRFTASVICTHQAQDEELRLGSGMAGPAWHLP